MRSSAAEAGEKNQTNAPPPPSSFRRLNKLSPQKKLQKEKHRQNCRQIIQAFNLIQRVPKSQTRTKAKLLPVGRPFIAFTSASNLNPENEIHASPSIGILNLDFAEKQMNKTHRIRTFPPRTRNTFSGADQATLKQTEASESFRANPPRKILPAAE